MTIVTKRRILSRALVLGVAIAAFSAVQAAPGGRGDGRGQHDHEKHLQKMKKHLGLSDAQVTQIRAIHKKYEPQHKELREKLMNARQEMHSMIMDDTADRGAVKAKMQEASATKVELRMVMFDQHREVRALLNPQQRAKLRKHMEDRRKRFHKGMGKGKGKGMGHGGPCGC